MNSIPLSDVLPWGVHNPPRGGRTVLICDSNETDGRFLLHTIASQCLSSKSSPSTATTTAAAPTSGNSAKHERYRVIWINCGAKTDAHVLAGMKKIGCDLRQNEHLVDMLSILPYFCQPPQNDQGTVEGTEMSDEDYVKGVYQRVKEITSSSSKYLIIMDDCSMLSTFFGASLTLTFVQKIRTLVRMQSKEKDNGLVLLASHDLDQENYIHSTDQGKRNVTGSKKMQYIGAGGRGILHDAESMAGLELDSAYEFGDIPWERSLVELADGIVDVIPLASGFAKDVHGRLVFTSRTICGWNFDKDTARPSNHFLTTMVNYCCTDAGVRAIRLRVG